MVYKVVVQDKGCIDSATVQVNVLQFITVKFVSDTAICQTDTITLKPISDALSYLWTESPGNNSLSNYTVKNPLAAPGTTTTYFVKANLGYCQDSAKIKVYVAPYPTASVGADTSICFGTRIELSGTITGSHFSWSPANALYNINTLHPYAAPVKSTAYILSVSDTSYCPKTVSDTIKVTVIPMVTINAGNDTSIVIGQSLQFNVSGGTAYSYAWQPTTELSNPLIYDPVATYSSSDPDSILYTITATTKDGCTGSDNILVKIIKSSVDILVPSGFTPNDDGRNDILKPILVGITKLNYFNVYNRWGQQIFSTNQIGKGWDGTFNAFKQPGGAYVYMAQGVDYSGNTIFRKGTVVLIR
jgi:gliding motility-associated-like protein